MKTMIEKTKPAPNLEAIRSRYCWKAIVPREFRLRADGMLEAHYVSNCADVWHVPRIVQFGTVSNSDAVYQLTCVGLLDARKEAA